MEKKEAAAVTEKRIWSDFFQLPEDSSKLMIVCHGGCGANTAKAMIEVLDPEKHPHLYVMVLESNAAVLRHHFVNKDGANGSAGARVLEWLKRGQLIIKPLGRGRGAGGDPEVGAALLNEKLPEIENQLKEMGISAAVNVGGGGGGTATGTMPIMVRMLVEKLKVPTCSILTIPSLEEAREKAVLAEGVKAELLAINPTVLLYNGEVTDPSLTDEEVWAQIREACLFPVIDLLRSLIHEVSIVNDIDLSDWEKALKNGGNHMLPAFFKSSKGVEGMNEKFLASSYLKNDIIREARTFLFLFRGKWQVDERREVMKFVEKKMGVDFDSEGVKSKMGVCSEVVDEERGVGLVAFAHALDGPQNKGAPRPRFASAFLPPPIPPLPTGDLGDSQGANSENPPNTINGDGPKGKSSPSPRKVNFVGKVNGKEQSAVEVSLEVKSRYDSIFSMPTGSAMYKRSAEVQEELFQETGNRYDVPKREEVALNGKK